MYVECHFSLKWIEARMWKPRGAMCCHVSHHQLPPRHFTPLCFSFSLQCHVWYTGALTFSFRYFVLFWRMTACRVCGSFKWFVYFFGFILLYSFFLLWLKLKNLAAIRLKARSTRILCYTDTIAFLFAMVRLRRCLLHSPNNKHAFNFVSYIIYYSHRKIKLFWGVINLDVPS